jgi:enamine deaminase RidA (YjgF/YER057c/UK114 family)
MARFVHAREKSRIGADDAYRGRSAACYCARIPRKISRSRSMPIERHQPGPRMSQAVVHGNTVYLAGQVADDTSQSTAGQTKQVLQKIDALLKAAGTDKSKLLSANVWLTDIGNFAEMNSAWDAWVVPGNTPARATVEAKLATPAYLVEIMVVAAKD